MIPTLQLGGLGRSRIRRPSLLSYWNHADKGSLIVLSNSDRDITSSSSTTSWNSIRSVTSHGSGKWYAEELMMLNTAASNLFGVGTSGASLTTYAGADAFGFAMQNDSTPADTYNNGSATSSGIAPAGLNERHMVAYDAATGYIWLGAKGVWANSGDPAAGTGPTYTVTPGTVLYLLGSKARSLQAGRLCNQPGENAHSIPSGFSMWG